MFKKSFCVLFIALVPLITAAQNEVCAWESNTGKVSVNYDEFYDLMYKSYETYTAPKQSKMLKNLAMGNAKSYMNTCTDFAKSLKRGKVPKSKVLAANKNMKAKSKVPAKGMKSKVNNNDQAFIRWVRQDFK